MALDRQSIEKKDFPVGRRGYEPAAVDAHLSAISEEVEELKRASRKRSESLATASSEQVRAIIDAAENSATEIHRLAEEDAREIRAEANSEAKATRDRAAADARQRLDKVSNATSDLHTRIEAIENELGSLFESIKAGANRINADLQQLESHVHDMRDAAAVPRFEAEPPVGTEPDVGAEPAVGAVAASAADDHVDPEVRSGSELHGVDAGELAAATAAVDDAAAKGTPPGTGAAPTAGDPVQRDPAGGAGDDAEGARLIALNMALNGTSREDTDRYLAENYKLSNRAALLDEVYEKVEG